MSTIILLLASILANAAANISMKYGVDQLPALKTHGFMTVFTSPWVWLGALLLITNFPLYNLLLQRMRLSLAFPLVTSCAFALAIIIGAVVFKEKLALEQYFGLLLLTVAVWLIAGFHRV